MLAIILPERGSRDGKKTRDGRGYLHLSCRGREEPDILARYLTLGEGRGILGNPLAITLIGAGKSVWVSMSITTRPFARRRRPWGRRLARRNVAGSGDAAKAMGRAVIHSAVGVAIRMVTRNGSLNPGRQAESPRLYRLRCRCRPRGKLSLRRQLMQLAHSQVGQHNSLRLEAHWMPIVLVHLAVPFTASWERSVHAPDFVGSRSPTQSSMGHRLSGKE